MVGAGMTHLLVLLSQQDLVTVPLSSAEFSGHLWKRLSVVLSNRIENLLCMSSAPLYFPCTLTYGIIMCHRVNISVLTLALLTFSSG